ncbi:MAG: 4-(cytidine 5'-diphospho)-2-C-methyl-D-erythritol kinase [Lachnospiraceae bacterium]|nr:4-(cytidine 5'-diphospho)-2-C-methyl-D-erythritol kinase [Lachnospiraceae bacterium]
MIKETAYAKVNLSLDVTGLRPNGYHDVKMVMQTVGICDELSFEKAENGIFLTTNSDRLNEESQGGMDNIIVKAARAIFDYVGKEYGVKITLDKHIPIAAGMAGGSTDAAATLRGLNRLFDLGLSMDTLREIAVTIGADVPFCVEGGSMLSEGIGEILTPLTPAKDLNLLICKPDIFVSTKEVYTRFDALTDIDHPDVDGMVDALNTKDYDKIPGLLGNVLELVTANLYPVISDIEKAMIDNGAVNSIMSGSGPTVFGIFKDSASCQKAEAALKEIYPDYFVSTTLTL